jgi:polyhydroxybutyrate depolymerase
VVAAVVLLVAVGVLLVPSRGTTEAPAQAEPLPEGASSQTVVVGDLERAYRPAELPAAAPLVLMLHGGGGSAPLGEATFGGTSLPEREGSAVVHPEGLHRTWNTEAVAAVAPQPRTWTTSPS